MGSKSRKQEQSGWFHSNQNPVFLNLQFARTAKNGGLTTNHLSLHKYIVQTTQCNNTPKFIYMV